MEKISLTTNEAIVLQQVSEDIEDNAWTLARQVGVSRHHILSIISHLQQKGLVMLENDIDGLWVRLTKRGRQLMRYIWPEAVRASA